MVTVNKMRWIYPSVIVVAAVAAASVRIIGAAETPDLTAHDLPIGEVVAMGDAHQHHQGFSNYDLPDGVALHGISPVIASRTTRLDAALTSTSMEPRSLAVDSDGGIWIAHTTGTLTYLSPTGEIEETDVGGSPTAVVVAAGRVWIADIIKDQVLVLDAQTRDQLAKVKVPTGPVALASSPGRIWVASITDGLLTSINTSNLKTSVPVPVGFGPIAIAVGQSELAIVNSLDRAIVRVAISAEPAKVGKPIPVPAGPTDAVFVDDAIWVSTSSAGKVARIDTSSSKVTKVIAVDASPAAGLGPSALLLDGRVIHVVNNRDRSVATIDLDTLEVVANRTFGLVGNETPSALDAVMLGSDLLIADTSASVLARLTGDRR